MKQVSFRIPEEMEEEIKEVANRFGLNKSEVFRQGLSIYLNLLDKSQELTNIRDLKVDKISISKEKTRNLFILNLKDLNSSLVISSSSSGGIGSKEDDKFKVNPSYLGKVILRASFGKIFSIKADPNTALLSFSNELDPTGKMILKGAKKEARKIGVKDVFSSHSEENIQTNQTGVSIYSIGLIDNEKLNNTNFESGNTLFSIGKPKVGNDFLQEKNTPNLPNLKRISKLDGIKRLIPIGNKGIKTATEDFFQRKGFKISFRKDIDLNLNSSAGPSSVYVAISGKEQIFNNLKRITLSDVSIQKLGKVISLK